MKYWLETYGCQMNVAESSAVTIELNSAGWREAKNPEESDLVLLNTCAVRQTAENRIWGRLGFYSNLKKKHSFSLVVMGCMAERIKDEIQTAVPDVDLVVGNFVKSDLLQLIDGKLADDTLMDEYSFAKEYVAGDAYTSYVPIMHGCNNFCTYCIVPYVRGREVSRPVDEILNELRIFTEKGGKEVTLLGQNVNSYDFKGVRFSRLLSMICDEIPDLNWIRFLSSHPKDLSDDLIELIAQKKQICNHLHLPIQHGSNSILKRMNRKYTREHYLSLIQKLRRAIPDIQLTTDLLIGFPGESEEDFQDTLDLIQEIRFADAFTYQYNPREGTKAYHYDDQVDTKTKSARLTELIEVQRKIVLEEKRRKIGQTAVVLVENLAKKNKNELLSRTEQNDMVVFPGSEEIIGTFATVTIQSVSGNTLKGELRK